MNTVITVGLTGGIGAGKSVVARVLRCNGFDVYDCDSEARRIMESDPTVKRNLEERIGKDIYSPAGELNRPLLASKIFDSPEIRKEVNSIVHEAVRKDIRREKSEKKGFFFIESAIIYSSGIDAMCDEVWIVEAPKEMRMERTAKRDNLTYSEIEKRIVSQEREFTGINADKVSYLQNDSRHPLLLTILEKTKLINNYICYVERNIGHNR